MMRPSNVWILILLLSLTSCEMSPLGIPKDYRSRSYDSPSAPAALAPHDEAPKPDASPLNDLSLERARDLGLSRNHTVQAASATVDAAHARLAEARAAFLPTLDVGIQRTRSRFVTEVSIPGGGSFPLSPFWRTTANGSLGISLFAWGRDRENLKAARADLASNVLDERGVQQQLLFEITDAWYRLHEAKAQVIVAQDTLKASERQLTDAKNVVSAGRATRDAELTAEVQTLERKQQLFVAENAVVHAKRILNTLLVREIDAPLTLAPPPEHIHSAPSMSALVNLSREHNPSLLTFRAQRMALDHRREAIERSFLPEVVGSVDANYDNFTQARGFSTNVQATVGAQWQVFSGLRQMGQLNEIHANLAALREQELNAIQQVGLQISRLCQQLDESDSAVRLAQQSIIAAEENYRIISERFRNGKTTAREVLDAQTSLSDSQFGFNQARFGYRTLLAALEAQVGVRQDDWLPGEEQ